MPHEVPAGGARGHSLRKASNTDYDLEWAPGQWYDRSAAEVAASLTPSAPSQTATPIDVLRYGIVPNVPGAASANTTALKALLDPRTAGPVGRLVFPPLTGTDIYHFDDIVEVRDGIRMDLMGCTLRFTKATHVAGDNYMGFLTFIRDVTVENGSIEVQYDGSGGINAGMILRVGARDGYRFGNMADVFDATLPVPTGNIVLRNLRLTTNNTGPDVGVLMLGGLRGVIVENIFIDGQSGIQHGIYYEFGAASKNGDSNPPPKWSSSHATGMHFRNIHIRNLKADDPVSGGAGLSLIGAYACIVENLTVDGAFAVFEFRPGEALFYRVWMGIDEIGSKRGMTLRNLVGKNITSTGLMLGGAESSSSGYLASENLTPSQQTDLMTFSVDGFALECAGAGITVSGACTIRNGTIQGPCGSGGIIITDECVQFEIDNVRVLGGSSYGIRGGFGANIYSPARKKMGVVRNSQFAGNTIGITLDNCEGVLIENNRLGYRMEHDGKAETTQSQGINVATQGFSVVCRGNYIVTASGSGTAYVLAGSGDRGCDVANTRGERARAGDWMIDGIARTAQLGVAAATINATEKYTGKRAYDTTTNRLYMALGPSPTSQWALVDGSATVTPA